NEDDKKKVVNAKAVNMLNCVINFEEYRKEGESIDEIFERFSIIINSLDAMGITHSKQVLVKKVLRSLIK
ncbi:hypothetical protein S245_057064, partial [Arachis hypogaea]